MFKTQQACPECLLWDGCVLGSGNMKVTKGGPCPGGAGHGVGSHAMNGRALITGSMALHGKPLYGLPGASRWMLVTLPSSQEDGPQ